MAETRTSMVGTLAFDAYEIATGAGIAALAIAVGALVVMLWLWRSTAPRRVQAGPATMELRDETPALVDLLVGGFTVEDDAVPATLVDLAQRGHVDIDELGGKVTIRRRRHGSAADEPLAPYEQRVLRHIERHTIDDVAPAEVLTIGPNGVSGRWFSGFVREVNQHGQRLGLCVRRFDLKHVAMAWAVAIVGFAPAWIVANAAPRTSDPRGWGSLGNVVTGLAFLAGLALVWTAQRLSRSNAQRDTESGREAAAHWLGVRDHYRTLGDFADKPAASVAIWDRHLAYATAMGLAPEVQRQLPFETEHDRHAWSRATGEWRRIKVRYQAFVPGWGRHPGRMAFEGALQAAITGLFAYAGFWVARTDAEIGALTDDQRRWVGLAGLVVAILAAAACLFSVVKFALGASDLFATTTIEGEVVRSRRLEQGHRLPRVVQWLMWSGNDQQGMSRDRQRLVRHHLAVDDGTEDSIVAHVARPEIWRSVPQGARVRMVVTPRIGYVRSVDMVQMPRAGAASEPTVHHELVTEAGRMIGDRVSGSIATALGHLDGATDEHGRPLLEQTDDDGRTLHDRLAEASGQIDQLKNDPRVRNSPLAGLLDSFMSSNPLADPSSSDRDRPTERHDGEDRAR